MRATQDDGCATRSRRLSPPLNSGVERPLVDAAFRAGEISYRCIADIKISEVKASAGEDQHLRCHRYA